MKRAVILWTIINMFVLASTAFPADMNNEQESLTREQLVEKMQTLKKDMLEKMIYEAYIVGSMSGLLGQSSDKIDEEAKRFAKNAFNQRGALFLDKRNCPYEHK